MPQLIGDCCFLHVVVVAGPDIYIYIYIYISAVGGVSAPCGHPHTGISDSVRFVSRVRASGRGEAAGGREGRGLLGRWASGAEVSSPCGLLGGLISSWKHV